MRPPELTTKIFLDSGLPEETHAIIERMGFLDGQTTNPSLITKHPSFIACEAKGERCTEADAWRYYREIVEQIAPLLPGGSVSIEVYADQTTSAEEMIKKGRELASWIPNAHVKLPITAAGLTAAHALVSERIRVNMTLCFSQEQAAAVYATTRGAKPGDVFVSPFIGRLDDRGDNGLDLITNMVRMFRDSDHHVQVLAASIRGLNHLQGVIAAQADILTAPADVLHEWAAADMGINGAPIPADLDPIAYQRLELDQEWQSFDIHHELTDQGLKKFASDWNQLVAKG